MIQYMPAAIMFVITAAFTALVLLPVRFYKMPNPIVNFYWRGYWFYLALISIVAGLSNMIILLGADISSQSMAVLTGLMASYLTFVVFAWFRLTGLALMRVAAKIKS